MHTLETRYCDGRSFPSLRMNAVDAGRVLSHGQGPDGCDALGAREASVVESDGTYFLFYDGAGPRGWEACLATSIDLVAWRRVGSVLPLGPAGAPDAAAATSPWLIAAGGRWHMFYLGTPNASPAPHFVPQFPYLTLKAVADHPAGPWTKQYDLVPFTTRPGTWRGDTASPGFIVRHGGEFLQYFSGSVACDGVEGGPSARRTLGIARARHIDGPWRVEDNPIVPLAEQIENSSLHYEPDIDTWFLFTNHIGCAMVDGRLMEYTDAIWVYWSRDPLRWNPDHKAVVLDGGNCSWSSRCIGMPSVIRVGRRLAVLYDAAGGDSIDHMHRDIGLAWLELPLRVPTSGG